MNATTKLLLKRFDKKLKKWFAKMFCVQTCEKK